MTKFARSLLVVLLVVCVPVQAALAIGAGQCMALQDHEGHPHADHDAPQPDHHKGNGAGTHCGPCAGCCASAAIASVVISLAASPVHDPVDAVPGFPPLGDVPRGFDRPPRAL